MASNKQEIHYLKDYRPSIYGINTIEMWIDFKPEDMSVRTRVSIEPAKGTPANAPLQLDGEELELVSLKVNGATLASDEYEVNGKGLLVKTPPASAFELESVVRIKPEKNTQLMGLYRSNGIWTTQCEAEGFRRITFMLDRPDIMATYRVHLEADRNEAPVLLSNGNLVESGDAGGGRHFAIWEDPHPKPTYLFAVVAGRLEHISDSFTTASGRKVDLAIYCEPGKTGRCGYAMDALKRSMKWDEERFEREYDLDVFNIVAVSDFNIGAMENKGLNIFNDKYILADAQSATDFDYYNIERIVAHEYFHNWTGNRITCRDWFQLCLKEGLTVYRDQEFTSDVRSRAVKRIEDARSLRAGQFPEDAGPLAHPARPDNYAKIDNFYTATVYNKGAEIVRMLATLLGREEFKAGIDLYFERFDGRAATIEDWMGVFEESSGRDLSHFFKWYTQAGTPEVGATGMWNEAAQTYILALTQHTDPTPGQLEKEALYIPLKFGLVGPNGQDMAYESVSGARVIDDVIILDAPSCELLFTGVSARPVLSLLRGFSAPVKLENTQSEKDELFLAQHDTDPFNRWQASQGFATSMMAKAAGGKGLIAPAQLDGLGDALRECLTSSTLDDAFKALVLALPDEGAISQAIGSNIDPEVVHFVRREVLQEISTRLSGELNEAYEGLRNPNPATQNLEEVHHRALRNQVLNLLVAGNTAHADELAANQYYGADNMTERMGALGAIVMRWGEGAEKHLAHFHDTFGQNTLVRDKWLGLMARAPDKNCLDRVRKIYTDKDFARTNPNRIYALIGSFVRGNVAQFTRADGAGFEFAAKVTKEIDPINPHVSANIMGAFGQWRKWETNRRHKAQEIMKDLLTQKQISDELRDILTRSLAE
ncbi:MAG TPA: aminopeptidase N [Devosia sp.]|nr:aminopeptidase N [Devosia sp.]